MKGTVCTSGWNWVKTAAKVWLGKIPIVPLCSAVPDSSVRLLLDSDIFYYGALSQLIFKKRCWLSVHLKKLHLPSCLKSVSSSSFCTGIFRFVRFQLLRSLLLLNSVPSPIRLAYLPKNCGDVLQLGLKIRLIKELGFISLLHIKKPTKCCIFQTRESNTERVALISNVRRYPSVWIKFENIFPQYGIWYETWYLKKTLVASCLSCGGSTTHEGSKKYTWPLGDLKELVFTNNSGNSRQRGLIVPSPTMLPATRNQESSVAWPFGSDYHNDRGKIPFWLCNLIFYNSVKMLLSWKELDSFWIIGKIRVRTSDGSIQLYMNHISASIGSSPAEILEEFLSVQKRITGTDNGIL